MATSKIKQNMLHPFSYTRALTASEAANSVFTLTLNQVHTGATAIVPTAGQNESNSTFFTPMYISSNNVIILTNINKSEGDEITIYGYYEI